MIKRAATAWTEREKERERERKKEKERESEWKRERERERESSGGVRMYVRDLLVWTARTAGGFGQGK
jgi:hypothetical protein